MVTGKKRCLFGDKARRHSGYHAPPNMWDVPVGAPCQGEDGEDGEHGRAERLSPGDSGDLAT